MTKQRLDVIYNEIGLPFSKWKGADKYQFILDQEFPEFWDECIPEYKFHPTRKWRLDFAWPEVMIGVEIDGFGWGHQAQQNMSNDNEKRNAAVQLGWKILVFDTRLLGSNQKVRDAVTQTCELICSLPENVEAV